MRKCFCDSCKKEIDRPNVISIPCHLYSQKHKAGYVDIKGDSVSGKMDSIDLCNKCQNVAYTAFVDSLVNLR